MGIAESLLLGNVALSIITLTLVVLSHFREKRLLDAFVGGALEIREAAERDSRYASQITNLIGVIESLSKPASIKRPSPEAYAQYETLVKARQARTTPPHRPQPFEGLRAKPKEEEKAATKEAEVS